MKKLKFAFLGLLLSSFTPAVSALEPEAGCLFVRVIDVGPGLCCVVQFPNGEFMVYDAGERTKESQVMLCGDDLGRREGGPDSQCIATEKFILEMAKIMRIDADVMVAPHHGANNASSTPFLQAVKPKFAVFSAGHKHEHPRQAAAERYLSSGVPVAQLFRTDRGDDEEGAEWTNERVQNQTDQPGDDDVDILIRPDGKVLVEYRRPPQP